ncbi:MAG: DUF1569 domain-containing protein [Planctomycetaceae bacterium]|nr:DUF1569 domain-containing protein [Planctomycetaceae bacterium]
MTVNTKKVAGRREVRYTSYADMMNDVEQMAVGEVRTLGNWSYGQILQHLATSLDSSIEGTGFMLPAPMRWLFTLLMKNRFLYKAIPAGFKTSGKFIPGETSVEEGLMALRHSVERQSQEETCAPHPAFGKITKEEWDAFNLRHAEMHMSFVVKET